MTEEMETVLEEIDDAVYSIRRACTDATIWWCPEHAEIVKCEDSTFANLLKGKVKTILEKHSIANEETSKTLEQFRKILQRIDRLANHYERMSTHYMPNDIRGSMQKMAANDIREILRTLAPTH